MKRPSFQFYPADWKQSINLRRCSEAARGAWMDILCALHDSDEYGLVKWPLVELAQVAGISMKLARELVEKEVLKGADRGRVTYTRTPRHAGKDLPPVTLIDVDGPCWYSSRMVWDEYVRSKRGASTRFAAEDQSDELESESEAPNGQPKPPLGDGPSTTSTSTSSKDISGGRRQTASMELPIPIPDWIPQEPWNGFVEMRKKIKAPLTERGTLLLIAELRKLRASGDDVGAVLDQSTMNNWKGVFPVKHGSNGHSQPVVADGFQNCDSDEWLGRLRAFQTKGIWPSTWGPKLGEPGCKIPPAVQEKFHQQQGRAA